jgi:hypothetical protein
MPSAVRVAIGGATKADSLNHEEFKEEWRQHFRAFITGSRLMQRRNHLTCRLGFYLINLCCIVTGRQLPLGAPVSASTDATKPRRRLELLTSPALRQLWSPAPKGNGGHGGHPCMLCGLFFEKTLIWAAGSRFFPGLQRSPIFATGCPDFSKRVRLLWY